MFELRENAAGNKRLFYTDRYRKPGERGTWVEVCPRDHEQAEYYVEVNRQLGLQVELDQYGKYRALVLVD